MTKLAMPKIDRKLISKKKVIIANLKKIIKTRADSVIGVVRLEDHHPLRIKKIVNGKIVNFKKSLREIPEGERQDLRPKAYIRNGSIYASRRDLLITFFLFAL